MEFVYFGSRPIDPKYRDETEVSKILRKFKGDDVFLGCVVCISTVCIKCVSRKGKKLTNTNTPKSENAVSIKILKPTIVHKMHSMIGQRKEYLW